MHVAFASGERAAFVEVYRAHAADVRRWVTRFFKRPFEQEEATQEVWLTVHRMAHRYDVNRELVPWLRVLTANRCRELLRARGRQPEASVPVEDADDAGWLEHPAEVDPAWARQVREAVLAFRATLKDDEAKALDGLLVEERSHEELAQLLGATVRQSKYLKKKLLERAAADPALKALAEGALE